MAIVTLKMLGLYGPEDILPSFAVPPCRSPHSMHLKCPLESFRYMRGFYLKAAQLVSTRDDFLRLGSCSEVPKPRPEVYLEWCRKLQDEVPMSLSSTEARQVICKDGAGISDCADAYAHVPMSPPSWA